MPIDPDAMKVALAHPERFTPISPWTLAECAALLAEREQLLAEAERLRASRDTILNHWYPLLGYANANEMAYPAFGDRRAAPPPALAEREEMLAAIRVACDRLEEIPVALSGADREHAEQAIRTSERARSALAALLR